MTKLVRLSAHALLRMKQQGLSIRDVNYIYENGHRYLNNGVTYVVLRKYDIPKKDIGKKNITRLIGREIIVDRNELLLITVYSQNNKYMSNNRRQYLN